MKTYPDELENPFTELDDQGRPVNYHLGLTKREHFAGLAMQGLIANTNPGTVETNAILAVMQADALIAELNKIQP